MSFTKCHEDLEIWKLSIRLVKETYIISRTFPEEERFGLTSQMRRAAISVPANIAELLQFLQQFKKKVVEQLSVTLTTLISRKYWIPIFISP